MDFQCDNSVVLLIVVIFIVFFIIFISQPCMLKRERFVNETFDIDNNSSSPYLFLIIYDLYCSTLKYFNWNDWYNDHDYFPPFVYKQGRYYFSENDPDSNKYAYLVHNGVDSQLQIYNYNSLTAKKYINSTDLGNIAILDKIIASLNNPASEINLQHLMEGFNLQKPLPLPVEPEPEPETYYEHMTPVGIDSSSDMVSEPADIDGIPLRHSNYPRGF